MRQMLVVLVLATVYAAPLAAQTSTVTATVSDGGSVVTELGYNVKVNDGSTLHRSWVVLNDSGCALQLDGAGVTTAYGDREYRYKPTGKAKISAASTAFEVRYLLFDVFGNHIKTLSGTEIRDLAAASELSLEGTGTWRAFENEVSELMTVVAFVAFVRTADSKVWRYNEKGIGGELTRVQLQVKSGILDPTKQQ